MLTDHCRNTRLSHGSVVRETRQQICQFALILDRFRGKKIYSSLAEFEKAGREKKKKREESLVLLYFFKHDEGFKKETGSSRGGMRED